MTTQAPNHRRSRAVDRDSALPQPDPFIGRPAVYNDGPADVVERFADAAPANGRISLCPHSRPGAEGRIPGTGIPMVRRSSAAGMMPCSHRHIDHSAKPPGRWRLLLGGGAYQYTIRRTARNEPGHGYLPAVHAVAIHIRRCLREKAEIRPLRTANGPQRVIETRCHAERLNCRYFVDPKPPAAPGPDMQTLLDVLDGLTDPGADAAALAARLTPTAAPPDARQR
ncbi:hypothetical protein [Nocardia sp. NPDC050412]|uniref:hypothetical protein n=1 Tax=Nocardia sp. NPDC050412 TaxID=3364320 RepID=UPI00378FC509